MRSQAWLGNHICLRGDSWTAGAYICRVARSQIISMGRVDLQVGAKKRGTRELFTWNCTNTAIMVRSLISSCLYFLLFCEVRYSCDLIGSTGTYVLGGGRSFLPYQL